VNKITPRVWTLIFGIIAVLSLILLAGSLSTLKFDPGHPISFKEVAPEVVNETVQDDWMRSLLAVFRVVLILGWVLLPIYLIMLIFSKEARKRFLRDMIMVLPILILLYLLSASRATEKLAEGLNLKMNGDDLNQAENLAGANRPPEFVPPPEWVTTLTIVVIAVVIALIAAGIIYVFWKRSRERTHGPIRRVEMEAQAALDAIETGGDLREAILRCYLQMIEALKEFRGIYRDRDMTPHEFEVFLSNRGMPQEPVHQLTQLFEQVRYGAHSPGRREEQIAVSSLSAIIAACKRTRSM
jgi:hypothetical protein